VRREEGAGVLGAGRAVMFGRRGGMSGVFLRRSVGHVMLFVPMLRARSTKPKYTTKRALRGMREPPWHRRTTDGGTGGWVRHGRHGPTGRAVVFVRRGGMSGAFLRRSVKHVMLFVPRWRPEALNRSTQQGEPSVS
jgi:hypothetical protein